MSLINSKSIKFSSTHHWLSGLTDSAGSENSGAVLTAALSGSSGLYLYRWTQMRDQTSVELTLLNSPRIPLNSLNYPCKACKRKLDRTLSAAGSAAECPLQRRNSSTFGGTFGGRIPQTEPNMQKHSGASCGSQSHHARVRRPNEPSAAEPEFIQNSASMANHLLLPFNHSNHIYSNASTYIYSRI